MTALDKGERSLMYSVSILLTITTKVEVTHSFVGKRSVLGRLAMSAIVPV